MARWLRFILIASAALKDSFGETRDSETCLNEGGDANTCGENSRRDAYDPAASAPDYIELVDWIRSGGGIVDHRQEVKRVDPSDPSSQPQIFATDFIPEGTVLARIPWDLVIAPQDPRESDPCATSRLLSTELANPQSKFKKYLQALKPRIATIPEGWSEAGKEVLSVLLGGDDNMYDIGGREQWWSQSCNGDRSKDPLGFQASMLAFSYGLSGVRIPKSEAYLETLVPWVDLYNHKNGDFYTAKVEQRVVGEDVIVSAGSDIQARDPIFMSKSDGNDIEMYQLFVDHGLVSGFPQYHALDFGNDVNIEFDITEVHNQYSLDPGIEVYFRDLPDQKALEFLEEELEALDIIYDPEIISWDGVTAVEKAMIERYHTAVESALNEALLAGKEKVLGERQWRVTDFTIKDFEVAGVNLATYGIAASATATSLEEPFELFQEFDMSHLISGNEDWNTLIQYRRSLKNPALSFYVDKVARKRWLPEQGFKQATHHLLKYKFELTESGYLDDEIATLLQSLPDEADFVAKPTHHSETSGVWIVGYDSETNTTSLTTEAKELLPDNSFNKRDVATGIAKNFYAKAAKHESWILKNVKPGVDFEERFVDAQNFARPPLEFCIFTIWGRVWVAVMNEVEGQNRYTDGFVFRNGTLALESYFNKIPFDYVDWPHMVKTAETLGRNKDMFRTDIFVGIPAGSPALRKGASQEEINAAVKHVVSECELHPTTIFHNTHIIEDGARLWIAGYKMGHYRTVPNPEVPREFLLTGSLSLPADAEANSLLRDDCRRDPTWRDRIERCSQATGYRPKMDSLFTKEFAKDGAWSDAINSCMYERRRGRSTAEHSLPSAKVKDMYPQRDSVAVVIENAFTEEEVAVFKDLTTCLKQHHGDSMHDQSEEGMVSTFLGGFLQLFAPGVLRQMYEIAFLGWEAAQWASKKVKPGDSKVYPFPDPRTTGIQASNHRSYSVPNDFVNLSDHQSIYQVVAMLSAPSDYEGGEYFIDPVSPDGTEEAVVFKPDRLSALVFLSKGQHGFKKITGGHLETWETKLWPPLHDARLGILSSNPADHFDNESFGDDEP